MEPQRRDDGLHTDACFEGTQRYIWTADRFGDDVWVIFFESGICRRVEYDDDAQVRAVLNKIRRTAGQSSGITGSTGPGLAHFLNYNKLLANSASSERSPFSRLIWAYSGCPFIRSIR